MKVVENNPQNARNCTIFKNFLGGAYPQSHGSRHAASRHVYPKSQNFYSWPPPLRNPAYAPGCAVHCLYSMWRWVVYYANNGSLVGFLHIFNTIFFIKACCEWTSYNESINMGTRNKNSNYEIKLILHQLNSKEKIVVFYWILCIEFSIVLTYHCHLCCRS